MRAVYMTVRIEKEAISESLLSMDHDELLELIKAIDRQVADYEFTKDLRDHFISEIESEDRYTSKEEQS